jgi:hypothetical protein
VSPTSLIPRREESLFTVQDSLQADKIRKCEIVPVRHFDQLSLTSSLSAQRAIRIGFTFNAKTIVDGTFLEYITSQNPNDYNINLHAAACSSCISTETEMHSLLNTRLMRTFVTSLFKHEEIY